MLKSKYQNGQPVWFIDSKTNIPHEGKVVAVLSASVDGGEASYTYSVLVSRVVTKKMKEEMKEELIEKKVGEKIEGKENFSEVQLYASTEECELAAKL